MTRRSRTASGPQGRRRLATMAAGVVGLLVAGAGAVLALTPQASAAALVSTLAPVKLVTSAGQTGSQPVSVLGVRDLSGSTDTWDRYVEFGGRSGKAYSGQLDYTLPSAVTAGQVTDVQVSTNYRGPATGQQVWTFTLWNFTTGAWTQVGTNASAPAWGQWKTLTFTAPSPATSFVSPAGALRVGLRASNTADSADLDYLALLVTSSPGTPATTSPTTAPTSAAAATTTKPATTTTTRPATTRPTTATTTSARPTSAPATTTARPTATATTTTPAGSGNYTLPKANSVFDYQIGGPYTPASDVEIVDRDHAEQPEKGKYNVCYVNGFQTQPGDSGSWPSGSVLTSNGQKVEDPEWEGEYLVDTRTATSRAAVMSVVGAWIDSCASKGFQAVEIDNLDSYTRDPSRQLNQAGNVALAQAMVSRAHGKGVAIAQKNTLDLAGLGKNTIGFDFVVTESCFFYKMDGNTSECEGYMKVYGDQVYDVEYTSSKLGGSKNFTAACDALGSRLSITYRDLNVVPSNSSGYTFKHC